MVNRRNDKTNTGTVTSKYDLVIVDKFLEIADQFIIKMSKIQEDFKDMKNGDK